MRKHGALVVLALLALAGLVYLAVRRFRSPGPQAGPLVDPVGAAAALVAELAQGQSGVSVADWRESHPDDEWHKQSYDWRADGAAITRNYCVWFARVTRLPDGRQLTRRAVFYPPDPPRQVALPTRASPEGMIENECTLGLIETRLEADTKEQLIEVETEARAGLSRNFGEPSDEDGGIFTIFEGSPKPVWSSGEALIAIGGLVQRLPNAPAKSRPELTAYAYLPNFQYEYQHQFDELSLFADSMAYSPGLFDLALQTAAMADDEALNNVYQRWADFDQRRQSALAHDQIRVPKPEAATAQAAAALQDWLQATRDLPPQQRAGALVAAYCVLASAWAGLHRPGSDNEQLRAALEAAGAQFIPGARDGLQPSTNWLKQALRLDPDGPIGNAITLASLAAGGRVRELLPDEYRRADITDYVIEQGTKYLARETNPALRARAEFYIASAYADRVAAGQGGSRTSDTPGAEVRRRGKLALPEALSHYRAVLALDDRSEIAVATWRSGWRLLAGLPVAMHY